MGGPGRSVASGRQDEVVRLDHISYACAAGELADVVQRIGSELGAPFSDGGIHPAFGTRNFILPLADGIYLEVVAALDHPAAEKAPFGRAVHRRADEGGGWLGWVIGVDDIAPVEARLGRSSVPGHRIRPDGTDLRWRQIGVLDLIDDPQLPYFLQWDQEAVHPSGNHSDVRLTGISMCGDPAAVTEWVGDLAQLNVSISWVEDEDRGIVACDFLTPRGFVRID